MLASPCQYAPVKQLHIFQKTKIRNQWAIKAVRELFEMA
ncbi:hypothetical protein UUU_36480 (plasmid) [Klebsiella pneumoniae subsp. pneumoniae DSM 30104 = JCM 1662 = NBRC 14940]|nr:hypothetical protein UUU_36480 [Klebsiella pneumoniae subsp. pneumoniae DSM 30104 = JCM 1662 = NBRC 14940]